MTTLTFTLQANGSADNEDRRAMMLVINEENARRTAFNSTTPPPVTPLTLLPFGTATERKTSYELLLNQRIAQIHAKYIKQAAEAVDNDSRFKALRPFWADANEATKDAVESALGAPVQ